MYAHMYVQYYHQPVAIVDEWPTTLGCSSVGWLMDGPPSHTPPGVGGRAKVGEMEEGWGRENAILVATSSSAEA